MASVSSSLLLPLCFSFPLPFSFSVSLSFVPLRSVKPIPCWGLRSVESWVHEGKRAKEEEEGDENHPPRFSRRFLSLITHVNTTVQPSKSRRCSWRFTVWQFYWPMSIGFRNHVVLRETWCLRDAGSNVKINIKSILNVVFILILNMNLLVQSHKVHLASDL